MWRNLGAWFWIAMQNLEDFPDASRKRSSLASCCRLARNPEGVVLADNLKALFRSVPPPLSPAPAMTERCSLYPTLWLSRSSPQVSSRSLVPNTSDSEP